MNELTQEDDGRRRQRDPLLGAIRSALSADDTLLTGRHGSSPGSILDYLKIAQVEIVPSTDGAISVVSETGSPDDYSRKSSFFDLHQDGLYLPDPPRLVLLFCVHPGSGSTTTVVFDGKAAVVKLSSSGTLDVLRSLEIVYVSRDGCEHARPLISIHPVSGADVVTLGSRAYVRIRLSDERHRPSPSLRDVTLAMSELFAALDGSIALQHHWRAKEYLLFDNYRYLHGRWASAPDANRVLHRIWLTGAEKATEC